MLTSVILMAMLAGADANATKPSGRSYDPNRMIC